MPYLKLFELLSTGTVMVELSSGMFYIIGSFRASVGEILDILSANLCNNGNSAQ